MPPLYVHPQNPRYFTDDGKRVIYLTGSHTWCNLQDIGLADAASFPYEEYLDFMSTYNHNFMRLWMFEQPERACWTEARIFFDPLPWSRPGPGEAADGKLKFDLSTWNEAYFERLRKRVLMASEHGVFCAVMLFQGWSLSVTGKGLDPWVVHPFNGKNNVNSVDVPFPGWDSDIAPSLHSLHNPMVVAYQEAYVRKVLDTLNDLDNVLYEVINEGGSLAWQVHIVDFVHAYEHGKAKQHPVGITSGTPWLWNSTILASTCDWYSPVNQPNWWGRGDFAFVEDYRQDPPISSGDKVSLADTDHLWGHGGNPRWVWKSFTRGHNPIFMDPWQALYVGTTEEIAGWSFTGGISKDQRDYPDWEPTRRAMGDTKRYADMMNLAQMFPRPKICSSRYCLANPGEEYLIYLPEGGNITLDLCDTHEVFTLEWFLPQLSRKLPGARPAKGGDYFTTTSPFTGDAVLYLKKIEK